MSDKPIVFSDTMILALGEGRKTQHRIVLKVQPPSSYYEFSTVFSSSAKKDEGKHHFVKVDRSNGYPNVTDGKQPCFLLPYYVGDRLYVREAWAGVSVGGNNIDTIFYKSVGASSLWFNKGTPTHLNFVEQKRSPFSARPKKWEPRTRMPRRFSRMTLLVTGVRIQRLSEISVDDAVAEGIEDVTREISCRDPSARFWKRYRDGGWNGYVDDPIRSYASLWTEINGAGSWEANPWVTAISFTVHHCNIDEMGKATP